MSSPSSSAFTARLSTGIVCHNRDGRVRRRMRLGRRQVVDADVRIYVQEVRAVHTAASDGGMRAAVRLPGMRRARPPCPPDRTKLPHHVGRNASGRRKVRARHRRIARPGKIARCGMQLLRRPGFQDGETCQVEAVSASLTDPASQDRRVSLKPTRFSRIGAAPDPSPRRVGLCGTAWRRVSPVSIREKVRAARKTDAPQEPSDQFDLDNPTVFCASRSISSAWFASACANRISWPAVSASWSPSR
jgi:hypothetical protein